MNQGGLSRNGEGARIAPFWLTWDFLKLADRAFKLADQLIMNNALLERLAALEPEQWAATFEPLSESEKEEARSWAKRVLALLDPPQNPDAGILYEGRFLRVKKEGRWEYVERPWASGIVAVLAITEAHELILVEQFRIPVGKRVIEIPAGLSGDIAGAENEALAEAAKRELIEEAGYEAERMEFLTEGPPSAGLSTEVVTFFRARGLTKVSAGGGDGSEEIQVHLVPLAQIDSWIEAKRVEGCLIDYKVYAVLYFYLKQK